MRCAFPPTLARTRDPTDVTTQKSFASVGELSETIIGFLAERTTRARRYVWQANGEDILRKIAAARESCRCKYTWRQLHQPIKLLRAR
jgi:hypothetical protein